MRERKAVKTSPKKRILRITAWVLVIVLLMTVGMFAVTKFIYQSIFPRFDRDELEEALNVDYALVEDAYPREKVEFYSGDNLLSGYVYGGNNNKGLVVIAPGFTSGAEDYTSQALAFVDLGYRVLTFDTTGSFESEGKNSVGFAQEALDLDCALEFVEKAEEFKNLPLFLFGHSRGGYASALMCAYDHNIAAVATLGAVNSPMEITMEWAEEYVGKLSVTGYPALYVYQSMVFGGELMGLSAAEAIDSCETPVLVIHSANDDVVSIKGSSIYAHKDEVKNNPNAEFMLYTDTSNHGHTTPLFTRSANLYRENIYNRYDTLNFKYGDDIPESELKKLYDSVDSLKAQEANAELIGIISDFYLKSIN